MNSNKFAQGIIIILLLTIEKLCYVRRKNWRKDGRGGVRA